MASAMMVVVPEEGDMELVMEEDAQVVVAVRVVADRTMVSGTATTTTTMTACTSTVLTTTLTSGLTCRTMARTGSTSRDEEAGMAAMEVADGTTGIVRAAIISGTF